MDDELIWSPLTKGRFVMLDIPWSAGLQSVLIGLSAVLLCLSCPVVGPAIAWVYVDLIRNAPSLEQMLIACFIVAAILGIPRL